MSKATVKVAGLSFDRVERGAVNLSMSEASNTFDFEIASDNASIVRPGDAVEISLGNDVVIDGYVDTVEVEDAPDNLRIRAAGRSKTADVYDSSAPMKRWSNVDISTIVGDLILPFGLSLYLSRGDAGDVPITKKFAAFSVQTGETVHDAIIRAAASRELFVYCQGGDLVIGRRGNTRVWARDVVSTSITRSWFGRFSDYTFRGQARPTDNNSGRNASQLKHSVQDSELSNAGRWRPKTVTHEANDKLDLEARATLTRDRNIAGSYTATCVAQGWFFDPTGDGREPSEDASAWRPNTYLVLENERLSLRDDKWLITESRFRFGADEPDQTELTLVRYDAYAPG